MHVVVVRRAENFVAALEGQAVIDEGQPLRRAVGERDFLRAAADISRGDALTRSG